MLHGWNSRQCRITWIKGIHSQRQKQKHAAFDHFRRVLKAFSNGRKWHYEHERQAYGKWLSQQRHSQSLIDRY